MYHTTLQSHHDLSHFISFLKQILISLSFLAILSLPKQFKVVQCTEKGKDGIKPCTCLLSVCWEYHGFVVEQTNWRVKGWGAGTTQTSSDPQNCLWQLGTHFTNCSNLSNYSLVMRYFVWRKEYIITAKQIWRFNILAEVNKTPIGTRMVNLFLNRCVDCRDKERSLSTMTS